MPKKKEQVLRQHAEVLYKEELDHLRKNDQNQKPDNWLLSPSSVVDYIMGGTVSGMKIQPKYFGQRRIIEMAVATLLTDRALLLLGVPGTAKTWLAEQLSAAISGSSNMMIQGSSAVQEDALLYGWNYALLLSKGPSEEALVQGPVLRAMREGRLVRIEELTRLHSEVQDSLITVLSEKTAPIPELGIEYQAIQGFNVIATANDRDKGINDMSSALSRRFNIVHMPLPAAFDQEMDIVTFRLGQILESRSMKIPKDSLQEIKKMITIFRELRQGESLDGKLKLKSPSGTLSTAEAISVSESCQTMASYFGDGKISARDIAASISGAILKDKPRDLPIWNEYLETVVKQREGWSDLYEECKAIIS